MPVYVVMVVCPLIRFLTALENTCGMWSTNMRLLHMELSPHSFISNSYALYNELTSTAPSVSRHTLDNSLKIKVKKL